MSDNLLLSKVSIKVTLNEKQSPPDKVAEAELHFIGGPLDGLRLIGFSVWRRRAGASGFTVTFPARSYAVNGERRSFALLRPIGDLQAQDRIRELIIETYRAEAERLEAERATAIAG